MAAVQGRLARPLGPKDVASSDALQTSVRLLPVTVSAAANQAPQDLESKTEVAVSCSARLS